MTAVQLDLPRPRLLDLFCGEGGCSAGYARAGFEVVGVDLEPKERYPFEFHQADALEFLATHGHEFDAIHASPPCHDHSNVTGRNRKSTGTKGTGWMLDETITRLAAYDVPWVVENVETAQMPNRFHRIKLCGSMFGLDVRRHRWFASNIALLQPQCAHYLQTPRFRSLDSRQKSMASVIGVHGHTNYAGELELRRAAMGIDWMDNAGLTQAIPPAYTEFVGAQLLAAVEVAA